MAERTFNTPGGPVALVPTDPGQWGVFTKTGAEFLGAIELESGQGGYTAYPQGARAKSCASLTDAVQFLGGGA